MAAKRRLGAAKRGDGGASKPKEISRESLEAAALRYLNRFDTSAENLRRVLLRYARRAADADAEPAPEAVARLIDDVLERYTASGLVNDLRFAESIARGLRQRGTSTRGIAHKLGQKGVPLADIQTALERVDAAMMEPDATADRGVADVEAARRFIRRRRLGVHRRERSAATHRKDLAALARAGFDFDVARRALGAEDPGDEF